MGNEEIRAAKRDTYRRNRGYNESSHFPETRRHSTINHSLEVPSEAHDKQRYHSIDYGTIDEESHYPE